MSINIPGKGVCQTCARLFANEERHKQCSTCRQRARIERFNDIVEYLKARGFTDETARRVAGDGQGESRCIVCGTPIKYRQGGKREICNVNPECLSAKRRMRTLQAHPHNMTKDRARVQMLKEVRNVTPAIDRRRSEAITTR